MPKFQAIQTAHEILGDPVQKQRYDADRRKAGLHPQGSPFRASPTPTGSPYTATSAYPPPPRRTQPGTWQRPQASTGPPASGADRFTQFPRNAPTARKDGAGAQDRTNMFHAWQNMQNAQAQQERQRASNAPPHPPPNRSRPPPPPRPESRIPTEDEIRAGMKYRKPPTPSSDADRPETRQTAWQAFHDGGPETPGLSRSRNARAPRKQGFDPNMPGSDERPASHGNYSTRHKSADFGIPSATFRPTSNGASFPFPPPPPGPPPSHSPLSPTSPTAQRQYGDPLKPFRSRTMDEEVPYAGANRVRTPYTNASGEKTAISSDGLRRSASVRDTSKMNSQNTESTRARSNSPTRRQSNQTHHGQNKPRKPFVDYSTSEESSEGDDDQQTAVDSGTSMPQTNPTNRPKKIPTLSSQRLNKSKTTSTPAGTDGAHVEGRPGMQQKSGNNMYATPPLFSVSPADVPPFDAAQWTARMFGSPMRRNSVQRGQTVPSWAVPSSVSPCPEKIMRPRNMSEFLQTRPESTMNPRRVDGFCNASGAQIFAYLTFRSELQTVYTSVPDNLDMDVFLKLASTVSCGQSTGKKPLDEALQRVLLTYPFSTSLAPHSIADSYHSHSFNFATSNGASPTTAGKSRSEESIDTSFSPDGFSGMFKGTPDYFAQTSRKKSASPLLRSATRPSGARSVTSHVPPNGNFGQSMPPPPRPPGLDEDDEQMAPDEKVEFRPEQWKKTFAEPSWAWHPVPAPGSSSPAKSGPAPKSSSRKASRASAKAAAVGTQEAPYMPEDDGTYAVPRGEPVPAEYGDAMDIDTPPPATPGRTSDVQNDPPGPRQYPVPPSPWHQQQQKQAGQNRKASNASGKLTTNLDDLAGVEPLARSTEGGLYGLADLSSTLPFKSQASATLPDRPTAPQQLSLPPMPKAPESPAKLTKQSWHAYSQAFGAYLHAYHVFSNTILRHFDARHTTARAMLADGCGWLEATGDTTGEIGFGGYLRAVKEDAQVREVWNLGFERHSDAVSAFDKVRERVRQLATAGTLIDH